MKNCPKCHKQNDDINTFCFNCGSPFEKKCPSCGKSLTPETKFCPECGTSLIAEESSDIETNVTLLSVDVQGSTEWISDKDVEQAYEWIDQALEAMSETVTDYHGHILALTGDGIAAYFDGDNHPLQACYTAAAMQQKLLSLKLPFHVRVGVHSAYIDQDDPSLILQSDAFKTTQSLEAKAPPDGIQISYAVRDRYKELLKTGEQESISTPESILPLASYTLRRFDSSVESLIQKPDLKEDESLEGFGDLNKVEEALGEHRFLTTCFIKVSSKTEAVAEEERKKIEDIVTQSISEYGGTFIKQVGETSLVCFGAPVAYEDHVLRACLASFFLLHKVTDYQLPLDVRIGIHCGEAIVNTMGSKRYRQYDLIGAAVNLAARLMQTASEDQIQLSEETLKYVEPYIQTFPLGLQKLKGIDKPIQTFSLTGINRSTIRKRLDAMFYGDSPFIGRKKEMKLFLSLIKELDSGKGSILAVKAEPGVGKTRLFYEFTQRVLKEEMITLSVSSSPYEQEESYSTLRLLIQNIFGVTGRSISPVQLNSIQIRLRETRFSEKLAKAAILTILRAKVEDSHWEGLSPILQEKILFQSTLELIQSFQQISPVLLIFEDLHWCDQNSLRFISFIAPLLKKSKIMLLLDYRSTFTLPEEIQQAGQEHLLEPLDEKMSQQLTEMLLPGNHDLIPLKERVIEITQGNPYFIEEYVKSLINSKRVEKCENGYVLTKEPNLEALPHTIESLINSEVDKLPKIEKNLLQQASILGRVFNVSFLQYINSEPDEVFNQALTALNEKGFLYLSEMMDVTEYTFKHAYLCDTVYHGMLKKTRQSYHQKLVSEIERVKADELHKYHYFLANQCDQGELWKKAIHYYNLSVPLEGTIEFPVIKRFEISERGITLYNYLSEEEKNEIINDYGRLCVINIYGFFLTNQFKEGFLRSAELSKELHKRHNVFYEIQTNVIPVGFSAVGGKSCQAYEQAKVMYTLLEDIKSETERNECQLEIDFIVMHYFIFTGKYHQYDLLTKSFFISPEEFKKNLFILNSVTGSSTFLTAIAVGFYCAMFRAKLSSIEAPLEIISDILKQDLPISESKLTLMMPIAIYNFIVGNISKFINEILELFTLAEQMDLYIFEMSILHLFALALYYNGEGKAAEEKVLKVISFFDEDPFFFFPFGGYYYCEVLARMGHFEKALDILEKAIPFAKGDNQYPVLAACYRIQALAYNLMAQDDKDDAKILQLLEKSKRITEEIGCNFQNPFIHLNYEEFYQRKGDMQKAEEHHQKALDYFKEYGMTGWHTLFSSQATTKEVKK